MQDDEARQKFEEQQLPPKNKGLAISVSYGINDAEKAEHIVHILPFAGQAYTDVQVRHITNILIELAKTWGMGVYKAENPSTGEVLYDAEQEQLKAMMASGDGGSNATH